MAGLSVNPMQTRTHADLPVGPTTSGPTGEVWEDIPEDAYARLSEAEIQSLCAITDYVDAAVALLSRFARVHRTYRYEDDVAGATLLLAFGADLHAWCYVHGDHAERWTRGDVSSFDQRRIRLNGLSTILDNVTPSVSLSASLADPNTSVIATTSRPSLAELVIDLWWANRLADGATPETARMLLGLTVPTQIWQRLVFPDGGGPPTMRATKRTSKTG